VQRPDQLPGKQIQLASPSGMPRRARRCFSPSLSFTSVLVLVTIRDEAGVAISNGFITVPHKGIPHLFLAHPLFEGKPGGFMVQWFHKCLDTKSISLYD